MGLCDPLFNTTVASDMKIISVSLQIRGGNLRDSEEMPVAAFALPFLKGEWLARQKRESGLK